MIQVLEAGSQLSHIRAEVCKALRADASWEEVQALLVAEAAAQSHLKAALAAEEEGRGWQYCGATEFGGEVLMRGGEYL